MNSFYQYPKILQWFIAILFMILLFILIGKWVDLTHISAWYYLLLFLITPIIHFLMTPFFTLIGMYKYLSPMLLAYNPSQKKYDLHNGTEWDYFFVMRGTPAGKAVQQKILQYFLEGLLVIVDRIEKGELSENVEVSGTSYFFSESTASRLGFEVKKPGWFLYSNLFLNFGSLLWSYSFSQGKFAIPNLKSVKAAVSTGKKLVENKANLEKLHQYLVSRNQSIEIGIK